MARNFTVTHNGTSRNFTVAPGVGPIGPAGTTDYNELSNKPPLGSAAFEDSENLPVSTATQTALAAETAARNAALTIINAKTPEISAESFGVVYTTSTDGVATTNAAALTAALAAASSTGSTLIIAGTVYVKGQVLVEGVGIRVRGSKGAQIIQKDIAHNGITFSTVTPPYGLIWDGVNISGQGAATHNAAAIYGQRGDLLYLTTNITIKNCGVGSFRNGTNLAGIAKFRTENFSISNVRTGHRWNHMQSVLLTNSLITIGDGNAASACFEITGGNFFAGKVLMGEFGGDGFARFINMSSGILHVEDANLESFTSAQTINLTTTGTRRLSIKNCRITCTYGASTSAIISAEVSGNSVPQINWENNHGWTGSPREIELYGTVTRLPTLTGTPVGVVTAATQAGTAVLTKKLRSNATSTIDSLPSATAGEAWLLTATATTDPDGFADNPLIRTYNSRTAANEWASQNNNMLNKVLGAYAGAVATVTTTETDLHTVTMPAGQLTVWNESLSWKVFGTTGANANNKTWKLYYGGVERLSFGPFAANDEDWEIEVTVLKYFNANSGGVRICAKLVGGTTIGHKVEVALASYALSLSATVVKITGTGTASGDITAEGARLMWHRAPGTI